MRWISVCAPSGSRQARQRSAKALVAWGSLPYQHTQPDGEMLNGHVGKAVADKLQAAGTEATGVETGCSTGIV